MIKLGSDTQLPLGDADADGNFAMVSWSSLVGDAFTPSNETQVLAFMQLDAYKGLSQYQLGQFDALLALQNAAGDGATLPAAADADATEVRFFAEQPAAGTATMDHEQAVVDGEDPLGDGDKWRDIKLLDHDGNDDTNAATSEEFFAGFVSDNGTAYADLSDEDKKRLDDFRLAQVHNGREWTAELPASVVTCFTQEFTRLSDFAIVDSYNCDKAANPQCNQWDSLKVFAMEDNGKCSECKDCNVEDEKLYLALCDAQRQQAGPVSALPYDSTGTSMYRIYDNTFYPEF